MNLIEKRDFIHDRLQQLDESLINELYEILHKKDVFKKKSSTEPINRKMTLNQEKYFPVLKLSERQIKPLRNEACLYRTAV